MWKGMKKKKRKKTETFNNTQNWETGLTPGYQVIEKGMNEVYGAYVRWKGIEIRPSAMWHVNFTRSLKSSWIHNLNLTFHTIVWCWIVWSTEQSDLGHHLWAHAKIEIMLAIVAISSQILLGIVKV